MKIKMTPHAITMRLKQTSMLRDLCLALGGNRLKEKIRKQQAQSSSRRIKT
jgi:hypothetical protein